MFLNLHFMHITVATSVRNRFPWVSTYESRQTTSEVFEIIQRRNEGSINPGGNTNPSVGQQSRNVDIMNIF